MVFHWRLSDSKYPQVSRTLLSILAVFNNAAVWMVSTRSPTSKSPRPFNNPLVTVPKAPITIGIIVTFMFQQGRGTYLSFHILLILFCGLPGQQSRQFCRFSFFFCLLIIIRSGLGAEIRWSVSISKSHRSLCVSFSREGSGLCIYYLLAWANLNFLHIFLWITLPTQSYLALYSFCANLLHSLIMWLMFHLCHHIVCTGYFVVFTLALIWLVLMALFCAAIRRDSVSLLVSFSLPYPGFVVWDVFLLIV